MSALIIMDRSGDTRHEFDATDQDSLLRAERRFRQLTNMGLRAVALGKDGEPGKLLRTFDPTVERTIFLPQLQGG
jgi:hypothetical protein